jgi:hypothetical protein
MPTLKRPTDKVLIASADAVRTAIGFSKRGMRWSRARTAAQADLANFPDESRA